MNKMIAAAVCAVAVSAFAATPEELVAAGKQALLREDSEKAASLFDQAVKLKPDSSDYHFWLGRAFGEMIDNASVFRKKTLASQSKSEFDRSIELDPGNTDPRFGLVEWYLEAPAVIGGSEAKAIEQADVIRKLDPVEGHKAFAWIATYENKPDVARAEYVALVREQPKSAEARFVYATEVLVPEKRWPEAFAELEATLKLDPKYMPAYFEIGHVAALSSTQYARGEESLRRYIAYKTDVDEPPMWRAWYWLGVIEEKTNRKAEAKQAYQTSLRMRPNQKDVSEALKRVR